MVSVTVFVEGGTVTSKDTLDVSTFDNSSMFREGFHQLFSQILTADKFDLKVQPIGSITQTSRYLNRMNHSLETGAVLVDLDGPKELRTIRLKSYTPSQTSGLFFMIQEMEAWILSQPEKLDVYGNSQGMIRKKRDQEIADDSLIKNLHPEDISKPGTKLKTLFRKYFAIEKQTGNRLSKKPRSYNKAKDGPRLIGLLDLAKLMLVFEDAKHLISYIKLKEH